MKEDLTLRGDIWYAARLEATPAQLHARKSLRIQRPKQVVTSQPRVIAGSRGVI